MPHVKRMINGDNRTRLRQSISLNHDETPLRPKRFEFWIQTRSPNNECPKLPAESGVCGDRAEFLHRALQVFKNPWHAHSNGAAIVMNQSNNSLRMDFRGYHNCTFEDDGYEQSHGLTEHVTQRQ